MIIEDRQRVRCKDHKGIEFLLNNSMLPSDICELVGENLVEYVLNLHTVFAKLSDLNGYAQKVTRRENENMLQVYIRICTPVIINALLVHIEQKRRNPNIIEFK